MKKLSKRLSLFVCLTIIANLLVFSAPVVLASNSEAEVLYKSSFSDYTQDGSPKGWLKSKYIIQDNKEVENTLSAASSQSEDGYHNNILKIDTNDIGSAVRDVIPFGKVISNGKLHISYDAKTPAGTYTNSSSSVAVLFNTCYNTGKYEKSGDVEFADYDTYDVTDFRGGLGQQQSHLLKVMYKDGSVRVTTEQNGGKRDGCTKVTSVTTTTDVWYHTDMIIDLDNDVYDVWIDGVKATDGTQKLLTHSGYNEFKGFGFLQQDGTKTGLYDNISITHYTVNDKIQMVADAGKAGIGTSAADGKYLNVSFNDTLKYDLRNNDFIITAADGSTVSGVVVTKATKSGCVLDFSAADGLKANTNYTVKYNNSNTGVATEVDANGASAAFRTNAATVDTSANGYKYYYAKEDFNEFTDNSQLPFGFYDYSYLDKNYSETYNKYLSAEKSYNTRTQVTDGVGNSGKALRVIGNKSSVNYYFPRGVISGDFTAEFDMKYNTGDWSIGFMPHINWMNAALEKSESLGNFRYNNALIGMSSKYGAPNLAIDALTSSGTASFGNMTGDWVNDTGLDIEEDKWAHIKLDFDMAEGNVDIYVTDDKGNVTSKENVSYGDWNKFGIGVDGLQIVKLESNNESSAYLDIDNLEVYTNTSRLLDQDFNGYTANSNQRYPYFWASDNSINSMYTSNTFKPSSVRPVDGRNAKSVEGKDGGEGNNAVEFYREKKDTAWYMTRFSKNVPAGQSYAVEFDLKYKDDNTAWIMGVIDSARSDKLIGYNSDAGNSDGMFNTTVMASYQGNIYGYNKYNYQQTWANGETINSVDYFKKLNSEETKVSQKNVWSHYKLVALPQTDNTEYILTVDGNEYKFTDSSSIGNNKKDIAGISFRLGAQNENSVTSEFGALYLDNVVAYLCDKSGNEITEARENSILDIEAEKLNGDTVSLMNTSEIPYSTKKITVTFSENLAETLKKDLTSITLSNNGVTGTTTAVYDCIEDVIQLRSKNTAYPMNYTAEIDGNKFIITLNDVLSSDTTYSLHIAKNVSFASSPYSTLDNGFSRTYTGMVDPDGGFKLTSCKAVVKSGDSWKEVTSFADITSDEANLGLKFNVTNVTGADKNIRAVAAFYDESGELAELVNVGIFDRVFASKADAQEQVLKIEMPTLSEGKSYTTVKFFAWDADSSAPLKRPQTFKNTSVTE